MHYLFIFVLKVCRINGLFLILSFLLIYHFFQLIHLSLRAFLGVNDCLFGLIYSFFRVLELRTMIWVFDNLFHDLRLNGLRLRHWLRLRLWLGCLFFLVAAVTESVLDLLYNFISLLVKICRSGKLCASLSATLNNILYLTDRTIDKGFKA